MSKGTNPRQVCLSSPFGIALALNGPESAQVRAGHEIDSRILFRRIPTAREFFPEPHLRKPVRIPGIGLQNLFIRRSNFVPFSFSVADSFRNAFKTSRKVIRMLH